MRGGVLFGVLAGVYGFARQKRVDACDVGKWTVDAIRRTVSIYPSIVPAELPARTVKTGIRPEWWSCSCRTIFDSALNYLSKIEKQAEGFLGQLSCNDRGIARPWAAWSYRKDQLNQRGLA